MSDPPQTPESSAVDLMKQEYLALRAEIVQSVEFQHRILIYGYGGAGVLFGYISAVNPQPMWFALICLPLILLAMIAQWVVECNRMVRASYYIGHVLWPEMCRAVPGMPNAVGWEKWIRRTEGVESDFRVRQDVAQRFVVRLLPGLLSLLCTVVALVQAFAQGLLLGLGGLVLAVVLLLLWCRVFREVGKVSDLAKVYAKANHSENDSI